jgi:hypothetical protein
MESRWGRYPSYHKVLKTGNVSLIARHIWNEEEYHCSYHLGLKMSAYYGHLAALKYFVEVLGHNPHTDYEFALRMSSRNGHIECVEYLIGIGCDPKMLEFEALISSSQNGHLAVVQCLMNAISTLPIMKGPYYHLHLRVIANNYIQALYLALVNNHWGICKCIIVNLPKIIQLICAANPNFNKILVPILRENFLIKSSYKKHNFMKFTMRPTSMSIILTYL